MTRLGRYELGELLGEGGEGQVYEAVLVGPGGVRRPVALKVLHTGAESLRREARIGGLLRHRHLVDVYEVNEAEGQWFCALERCVGSLVPHIPLPPRAVVEVGVAVCEALEYAWEDLGLVHLDLKPANLLVAADGTVKVADLGISRAEGFEVEGIRGTPAYMPPEQFGGGAVDSRSDIYALGITLLELATGTRTGTASEQTFTIGPVDEDSTLDLDSLDVAGGSAAPRTQAVATPEWLLPIVARCTEELPARRFQSMGALRKALGAVEVDGPGLREVLGLAERVAESPSRGGSSPQARDAFVGRTEELAALAALLEAPGSVTLRGPAGVGKSRLARHVATTWSASGRDSWVCALSEVRSLDGLLFAVAQALEIRAPKTNPVEGLGHALAGRGPALLVLDTFEHLTDLAPTLETWCAAAPGLRILVTSQRPLGLADEQQLAVAPLDTDAAVELLVARARTRGVDVSDDPDLPELARRLEGLPLALELAAGRLGVLTVRDVLDRLGLGLLRAASEGRHGTLRAALSWSWDQLTPDEAAVMTELSVFSGSFAVEAAEEVLGTGGALLDLLDGLVAGSMVAADGERLALLSSVREFAAEQGPTAQAEARHGAFYARLGTPEHLASLLGHGGVARRQQLAGELDNLLAAHRSAAGRGDVDVAAATALAVWSVLELAGPVSGGLPVLNRARELASASHPRHGELAAAMARALQMSGDVEEGVAILEEALAQGTATGGIRAELLRNLGDLYRALGRTSDAEARIRDALEQALAAGDGMAEGKALSSLATICHRQGKLDEAEALESRASALYRALGNQVALMYQLSNLGILQHRKAEFERASELYEQARALSVEVAAPEAEAWILGNIGAVHAVLGRVAEAREAYGAALAGHRRVGSRRFEATVLGNLANLHLQGEDFEAALEMYESALQICRDIGDREAGAVVQANLGGLYVALGRIDEGLATFEAAQATARELGVAGLDGHLCYKLGALYRDRGELDRAAERFEAGEALLRRIQYTEELGHLLAERAVLDRLQGKPEQARLRLAEARELAVEMGAGPESELGRRLAAVEDGMRG